MANLPQIERVLFFQETNLFTHCSTAQVMRIAAIASERTYPAGERVYSINDPSDAIHCLVDGGVRLENGSAEQTRVEPGTSFGVLDLMSGRLRTANATAETDTVTLAIEADDFFDLLSNNIEIVKALVRFLSDRVTTPLAW